VLGEEASAGADPTPLERLRTSARGWHGVQLAVIGFIGFCGVIQDGRADNPQWLQAWAGILALVALALASVATFLVGRVAWPLYGGRPHSDATADLAREGRRLRLGLVLTFAALGALALGTASGWWPQKEAAAGSALVEVQAATGERWCGSLQDAAPGALAVDVDGSPVVVALRDLAVVRSVDGC
jgi:drug/metabolite transporter (DMT)-like permease